MTELESPTPTLQYLQVPPTMFIPRDPIPALHRFEVDYLSGQGIALSTIGSPPYPTGPSLLAPVQLPHGAEITGMTCYARDASATSNLAAGTGGGLARIGPATDTYSTVVTGISLSTSGQPGIVQASGTGNPFYAVVDNEAYSYRIEFNFVVDALPDTFDPQFRGCRIAFLD